MNDHETWRPTAEPGALRLRAAMLARAREYFAGQGVLEVETPYLSCAGTTDINIHSLVTRVAGQGRPLYLHTSPEFPMKRLLAAGSGDIYQFARVFRDGESGRRHNPEFTMLEYYRLGMDDHRLMDDLEHLLAAMFDGALGALDFTRVTYRDAFLRATGVDPLAADRQAMLGALSAAGVPLPDEPLTDAQLADLVMGAVVCPGLGSQGPCFVTDYPADQAALARIRPGNPPVAARFELFYRGMELANGFHELQDETEQRQRFESDNRARLAAGLSQVPADENMLRALQAGLPDCAGVAVGFDRLVMLAAGTDRLSRVLAFDITRA